MKYCPKCEVTKGLDSFYKSAKSKDGLQGYCKECVKALSPLRAAYRKAYREKNKNQEVIYRRNYRLQNKEKIAESTKQYVNNNPDRVRESKKRYRENNPDKVRTASRNYQAKNKHKYAMYSSRRRAAERRAQPKWLNLNDQKRIELVWGLRELKSFVTGTDYEVDHIVPLRGKTVCGLHVPWNLRVIPRIENRRKHALYWPDMW